MDYKGELIDAVVCSAAFWGIDKYYYGDGSFKRAAFCGGCDAVAAGSKDMVHKWIVGMNPTIASNVLESTLKPTLTGAIYLGANKLMPMDNKPTLYQFLHATGASYLGSVATPYVRSTLKL